MISRSAGRLVWAALFVVPLLSACAAYDGRGLQPGVAALPEVLAVMGEPALRWQDADGSQQLAYPRGPAGYHTYMVLLGPDGRLQRVENRLDAQYFNQLESGKTAQAAVLRLLGPPVPEWEAYFKARDELVREYRFCNIWGESARFDVLFDGTSGIVRSWYERPESSFQRRRILCSR